MQSEMSRGSADHAGPMAGSRREAATRLHANESLSDETRRRIIAALRNIYDPEIPVDIYELGLIYDIDVDADGNVRIRMTLTTPMCPVAESLPRQVESVVGSLPEVSSVELDLVWDPPWTLDRMSEAARLQLNL